MSEAATCPECGARWQDGITCWEHFERMLAREFEDPAGAGAVHHLTVLCYGIQHPSAYSAQGLAEAKTLLVAFVERGDSPANARRRNRQRLDSGRRTWKIAGTAATLEHAVHWPVTIVDVSPGDADNYCDRVERWARSICQTLSNTSERQVRR
ncbi:MAG: hypothetical protein HPY64_04415 [Anaerolineae bacterium]|nr:hypothetical protein [Anaerolineae bacterium]